MALEMLLQSKCINAGVYHEEILKRLLKTKASVIYKLNCMLKKELLSYLA